jgi:hypothetical protein
MKIDSFGGFVHNQEVPRPIRSTAGNEQAKAIHERYKSDTWKPGTSLFLNVSQFAKYERNGLQVRLQKLGMKVTVHLDPSGKLEVINKGKDNEKEVFTGKVYIRRMTDTEWKEYCTE